MTTCEDCAAAYKNENEVGEGIKRGGIDRDQLFITSKVRQLSSSLEKGQNERDSLPDFIVRSYGTPNIILIESRQLSIRLSMS